jgi:hypothetical protein
MAGTRKYRRKANGQFAGSGGGTVTTTGRSGGFASATHRGNVASKRAATARRKALVRNGVRYATIGVAAAGAASLASHAAGSSQYKSYKTAERASTLASQAKIRNLAAKSINAEMSFKSRNSGRRLKK